MTKSLSIILILLSISLFSPKHLYGGTMGLPSYIPKQGYVPDEKTAVAIAEAVLKPIYGEENINGQKPFDVDFSNGIWKVRGTRPKGKLGGVFYIEISKETAAILYVSHGR